MNRSPDGPDDDGPGKDRPDFSAVTGSSASTAAPGADRADFSKVQSSVASTAARSGEQSYLVEKGDNLSAISKKFYGSANHWREIFEANRDQLDNPDLIHPGQTLRIPARDSDGSNAA